MIACLLKERKRKQTPPECHPTDILIFIDIDFMDNEQP
jgi:hypothetical protein